MCDKSVVLRCCVLNCTTVTIGYSNYQRGHALLGQSNDCFACLHIGDVPVNNTGPHRQLCRLIMSKKMSSHAKVKQIPGTTPTTAWHLHVQISKESTTYRGPLQGFIDAVQTRLIILLYRRSKGSLYCHSLP